MSISNATGSPYTTGAATQAVTTQAVGNFVAVAAWTNASGATATISDTSSRITWQGSRLVYDNDAGNGVTTLMWWGTVASTGTTTITMTWTGGGAQDDIVVWELHDSTATNSWSIVQSGSNNSTATALLFPSLTSSSATDQAYLGYAAVSGSLSGTFTGFTAGTSGIGQAYIYDLALAASTAFQPSYTDSGGTFSDQVGLIVQSAPSASAKPQTPIVRTTSKHRKGVIFFRKTPPVFTAPNQFPIVRTFRRRNRGVEMVLAKPPIAPTQKPIVVTVSKHRKGFVAVLRQGPQAYPPGAPIVVTFHRRNKGQQHLLAFPPVFTAPNQFPIVRTFRRRNKGVAHVQTFTAAAPVVPVPSQLPIVHSFKRRNPGAIKILHSLPVFTAPSQTPIVQTFHRRNRGHVGLFAFPPLQATFTPAPIVRTFVRRNKGRVWIIHSLPIFTPATQTPIVRTVSKHRRGVVVMPPRQPPPPFTIGILASDTYSASGDTITKAGSQMVVEDTTNAGFDALWDLGFWDLSVWGTPNWYQIATDDYALTVFDSTTLAVSEDDTTEGTAN